MNKDFYNSSGYKDLTAGNAIKHVAKNEQEVDKRAADAVHICKRLIDIAGFELIGRIELKDKKTGIEYK